MDNLAEISLTEIRKEICKDQPFQTVESGFGFHQIAEEEVPSAPRPVLVYPGMEFREWVEICNQKSALIPAPGCLFGSMDVYGAGHVLSEGRLVTQNIGLTDVEREWHAGSVSTIAHRQVVRVTEPCISFIGPGYRVYGHWIADFMPRLHIARLVLGDCFGGYSILLPSDTPEYVLSMLKTLFFNQLRIRFYDLNTEVLRCERLCLPTYPFSREHHFHSIVGSLYDPFRDVASGKRKIYVSRRRIEGRSTGIPKAFPQLGVFEALAVYHGYDTIYPEEHAFQQQIEIFKQASVVIGEFGSALHNSVFAGPGTIIGAAGFFNECQLRFCALSNQTSAYLTPRHQENVDGVLHYNCDFRAIVAFFEMIENSLSDHGRVL